MLMLEIMKTFKGTVVNWALLYLKEKWALKIRLTVRLGADVQISILAFTYG